MGHATCRSFVVAGAGNERGCTRWVGFQLLQKGGWGSSCYRRVGGVPAATEGWVGFRVGGFPAATEGWVGFTHVMSYFLPVGLKADSHELCRQCINIKVVLESQLAKEKACIAINSMGVVSKWYGMMDVVCSLWGVVCR